MQEHLISFIAFITSLMLAILPAPLWADQMLCTSNGILIEGSSQVNISEACEAVKSAAHFFQTAGLSMPSNILIRFEHDTSTQTLTGHEIGHYNALLHTIVMKDYHSTASQSKQPPPELWSIDSLPYWQSYLVHELAHAAIHADCDQNCPSRAIDEYIAAVAQISVLPEEYRSKLVDSYPNLKAWESKNDITEIYYAFDPHKFAIKSYKHYQQQTDHKAFMQRLLTSH
jgi:hypothetical protein